MASFSPEPILFLFVTLFLGGILSLIFALRKSNSKDFASIAVVSLVLIVAGIFGPTLFNMPPTPFVLAPSLNYASQSAATAQATAQAEPVGGVPDGSVAVAVPAESSSSSVVVVSQGTPVKGAIVVISNVDGQETIGAGITDGNGEVNSISSSKSQLRVNAYVGASKIIRQAVISPGATQDKIVVQVPLPGITEIKNVPVTSVKSVEINPVNSKTPTQPIKTVFGPEADRAAPSDFPSNAITGLPTEEASSVECVPALEYTRGISSVTAHMNDGSDKIYTVFTLTLRNSGCKEFTGLVREEIPVIGSEAELAGISVPVYSTARGSLIVNLLFEDSKQGDSNPPIKPGESSQVVYTVAKEIPNGALNDFKAPIAYSSTGSVIATAEKQSFDQSLLALVFALVIVGSIIALVIRRK